MLPFQVVLLPQQQSKGAQLYPLRAFGFYDVNTDGRQLVVDLYSGPGPNATHSLICDKPTPSSTPRLGFTLPVLVLQLLLQ